MAGVSPNITNEDGLTALHQVSQVNANCGPVSVNSQ